MKNTIRAALAAASLLVPAIASAQNLRIGLREDPDILDPTLSRTYVGRIVYMALCDKLFDVNERLEVVPQLATGFRWENPTTLIVTLREGVRFHDGEAMDAEAVRYSLNRHLTLQGSFRRSEIADMERVEVVDPRTVRIVLKAPSASFVAALTDRAGMIVSPKAAEALGRNFGTRPVCAGPFRFVERVAQERIVVERGEHPLRPRHLPAHPRQHRAPGQPSVRRRRIRRANGARRHEDHPARAQPARRGGG